MRWLLITLAGLACSTASSPQDMKRVVLAGSRSGIVEFIDPVSLNTFGRLHIDLPLNSVGLTGISASADGSTIYVEGPIADDPNGCCSLYSIDLATLKLNRAASVPGSASRAPFLVSDGLVYQMAAALSVNRKIKGMSNDRLHLSPDRRWLFGVRAFRGPALDVYDLAQGNIVRQLSPKGLEGDWQPSGVWSGNQFYFYASKGDDSAARLWVASADTTELGVGTAVEPIAQAPGCPPNASALTSITASKGNVFVYELFGFIGDRRVVCPNLISGGAWQVDPSTGRLLHNIAPGLHFSVLIPDREEPVLYGLSNGGPDWQFPVEIVRIDARNGDVLQSHALDSDRWSISAATLRVAPTGDVRVTQDHESKAK